MITTIIFDIGGVFVKGSSENFIKNASKMLGVNIRKDDIKKELWDDLMRGKISLQEFMSRAFGIPISDKKMEELIDLWIKNWKLDPEMVVFAKRFKPKYRLVMLSNVNRDGLKRSKNNLHFNFFDYKFLSFDLGLIKPEREIYEHVLKEIDARPEECVFIDDKPENVEAARKLGIHGIVFQDKEQLKQDLKKIGVILE